MQARLSWKLCSFKLVLKKLLLMIYFILLKYKIKWTLSHKYSSLYFALQWSKYVCRSGLFNFGFYINLWTMFIYILCFYITTSYIFFQKIRVFNYNYNSSQLCQLCCISLIHNYDTTITPLKFNIFSHMITLLPCENFTHDLLLDFIGSRQESQWESSHGFMRWDPVWFWNKDHMKSHNTQNMYMSGTSNSNMLNTTWTVL